MACILDASALLALFQDEPGAALVEEYLRGEGGALVSTVNWAEVLTKVADSGRDPEAFEKQVLTAEGATRALKFVEFSQKAALWSAKLRPPTRHLGLSLGDRACLSLALQSGLPVLTADAPWKDLAPNVVLIR